MQTVTPTGALYINDQQQLQEPHLHSTYSAMPFFRGDSRSEGSLSSRHSNYSAQKPEYMDGTHQADGVFLPHQVPLATPSPTCAYGQANSLGPQPGDLTQDWAICEQNSSGGMHLTYFPPLLPGPRVSPLQDSQIDTLGSKEAPEFTTSVFASNSTTRRSRRGYEDIIRRYSCNRVGCQKAYGTKRLLNRHKLINHGAQRTGEG